MPPELIARLPDWLPDWYASYLGVVIPWIVRLDYGNVQEFITWIVAGFALVFAAKAASAAGKTNELQDQQIKQLRADQKNRDDDKRREQAECIGAWCDSIDSTSIGAFGVRKWASMNRRAMVLNSSRLPIYHVTVYVQHPEHATRLIGFAQEHVVPPTAEPMEFGIGGTRSWDQRTLRRISEVGVYFADTRRRFWHRDQYGELFELDKDEFWEHRSNFENLWEESREAIEAEAAERKAAQAMERKAVETEAKAKLEAATDDEPR